MDNNTNNTIQGKDSTIALSEKDSCSYCEALKIVEPEEELKECPYCIKEDESTDSCKYCMNMEDKKPECKYCNREEQNIDQEIPSVQEPTTQSSEDFASQGLNEPAIPKPHAGDRGPIEAAVVVDDPTPTNKMLEDQNPTPQTEMIKEGVILDHSREAMEHILNEIENDGSPKEAAQNIDSTELAVGTEMEGNISRQAGFESQTPGEMGMPGGSVSEEPSMMGVLSEGFDHYQDDIQRERVINMVSQALQGFKQCKPILDKAQVQAPQLYNSSLAMLKAMIEMAKMLGLNQQATEPIIQENEPQNPWHDPFPVHPENDSKQEAQKSIGGAGALPTSATTKHVARTPQTEGSVNELGQMKITDPNTGKAAFIDMKIPRVLSPTTGKPVTGK